MCIILSCFKCNIKNNYDDDNLTDVIKESNSHYEKLKQYSKFTKIGKGATSKIYLTNKEKKTYICKSLYDHSVKRGFREIKILQKLNGNDYFPKIHEFINFGKNLFIFMEYEQSVDLHKYFFEPIKNDIPLKATIHIIREMGNAIENLHSYNFVHLDLKLENFIITNKKKIKLIDFGTVKPTTFTEKKLFTIVGTKNYSAPEIYRYRYHCNSDVWSYGICVWILLIQEYCFNHADIRKTYTIDNFPHQLFKFPSKKHLSFLKKFNIEITNMFKHIFKQFPIDRPNISYIKNFNYEKYLIANK